MSVLVSSLEGNLNVDGEQMVLAWLQRFWVNVFKNTVVAFPLMLLQRALPFV